MLDPNGEDAAMWAAQRAATQNKLVAGAVTAGVGAVGSLAANIAVNRNNPNRVKEILAQYTPLKKPLKEAETKINEPTAVPPTPCSSIEGTTGVGNVPNCACTDPKARYFQDKGCVSCPQNQEYNANNECECPAAKPVQKEDGSCVEKAADCLLTGLKKDNCQCIDNAHAENNVCKCDSGYNESEGKCVKQEPVPPVVTGNVSDVANQIDTIRFDTDGLFDSSKYVLRSESQTKITQALNKVSNTATENNIDLKTATDYCLIVVGKTDRTPFAKGSSMNNRILSERRAQAIADELQNVFNKDNIRTFGIADADCSKSKYPKANDPRCRSVEAKFMAGTCDEILSNNFSVTDLVAQHLAPNATSALASIISSTKEVINSPPDWAGFFCATFTTFFTIVIVWCIAIFPLSLRRSARTAAIRSIIL